MAPGPEIRLYLSRMNLQSISLLCRVRFVLVCLLCLLFDDVALKGVS